MKFSLRLLELEADSGTWEWLWLLACADVSRLVLAEEVTQ